MRRVDEVLTEVGKCKSDGDQNHNGLRETGGPKRAGAALIGQSKIADDTHTDNQDKTGSRGAEAEIDGSCDRELLGDLFNVCRVEDWRGDERHAQ